MCVYAVLHWAVMSNFSAYMVNMHMVNMQKQLVQRKHITCNPFVVFTHAHTSMAIRMHVFDIVFSLRMWYTSYSRPHAAYSVLHVHSLWHAVFLVEVSWVCHWESFLFFYFGMHDQVTTNHQKNSLLSSNFINALICCACLWLYKLLPIFYLCIASWKCIVVIEHGTQSKQDDNVCTVPVCVIHNAANELSLFHVSLCHWRMTRSTTRARWLRNWRSRCSTRRR